MDFAMTAAVTTASALYLDAGSHRWKWMMLLDPEWRTCPLHRVETEGRHLSRRERGAYHVVKFLFLALWPLVMLLGWIGAQREKLSARRKR